MLNPCSVIYFPGSGGNFIQFCLSLSPETVPYYHKNLHDLNDEEIDFVRSMTVQQRKKFLKLDTLTNFQNVHYLGSGSCPIVRPDLHYPNKKINDYFKWVIMANHPDSYYNRLPWLKKIIYLDIDIKKYIKWTNNARQYFEPLGYKTNFFYDLIKNSEHIESVKANPMTIFLSMDEVLDSQSGFEKQYLLACSELNITPELEHAVELYQGWRRFRVDPFL